MEKHPNSTAEDRELTGKEDTDLANRDQFYARNRTSREDKLL
jgi:hypothetical protein